MKTYKGDILDYISDPELKQELIISRYLGKLLKEFNDDISVELAKKLVTEKFGSCPGWILTVHFFDKFYQSMIDSNIRKANRSDVSRYIHQDTKKFILMNRDIFKKLNSPREVQLYCQKYNETHDVKLDPKTMIDLWDLYKKNKLEMLELENEKPSRKYNRKVFYRKYGEDYRKKVLHLFIDKNYNYKQIEKALGISTNVIMRLLRESNIDTNQIMERREKRIEEMVLKEYEKLKDIVSVAKSLNISINKVNNVIKKFRNQNKK